MKTIDKIFFGHTPVDQRKFIRNYLEKEKAYGEYSKIHIPCVGAFSLVKAALDAGYSPSDITSSDISLYSTLLGYFFMDRSIDTISFEPVLGLYDEWRSLDTKPQEYRIGWLFYQMKQCQYKEIYAEYVLKIELQNSKNEVIDTFATELLELRDTFKGVKYEVADIRKELIERPRTITIINPPVISKGYTKMFDFREAIQYDPYVEEFNWNKEFVKSFQLTGTFESPYIWYRYKHMGGLPSDKMIFAKQYPKRWDYWLINNPKFYRYEKVLKTLTLRILKPIPGMEIFTSGKITENSHIKIFSIKEEHALYYRDLFAHKLGVVKAETYVALTIDDRLFGTAGFMMSKALRLQVDYVFESYAFSSVHKDYPELGRLLMMCLTCEDTQKALYALYRKNQIYKLDRFKTTCLSKYRKVKKNNNLLQVTNRLKEGNFYKIDYETRFYINRTYADCIKLWLQELAEGRKL